MFLSRRSHPSLAWFVLAAALSAVPAYANQLVYVPLAQPCRLLDTRTSTGGPGPLTAAHGAYLFGTNNTDIQSATQHGSTTGCSIPAGIEAVSVSMNLLDATAPGNIATWSPNAGPTAPNIGTAVYNPTVASAAPGQVQYNTGYTSVPVGSASGSTGRFYLQVANGQIDMTINLVGYWLPVSWGETRAGYAIALGYGTTASNFGSTALGVNTQATGDGATAMGGVTHASEIDATAMGYSTTASGLDSTAMGDRTTASGHASTATGEATNASGSDSTAIGYQTSADGDYSTAMGSKVGSGGHRGSFVYGDASTRSQVFNTADNQFVVAATGGTYFFSGCDMTACSTGVGLAPGSGSWFSLSDRNAKTAAQPIDPRQVLKKVVALPLNTWQYKTQDSKYRHIGPMAQDFYAAFQLGESDKGIDTVDADGVALAAIQGLHAELSEKNRRMAALAGEVTSLRSQMATQTTGKDAEIAALHAELSAQKTAAESQKKRVAALESLAGDVASLKMQLAALRLSASVQERVALVRP